MNSKPFRRVVFRCIQFHLGMRFFTSESLVTVSHTSFPSCCMAGKLLTPCTTSSRCCCCGTQKRMHSHTLHSVLLLLLLLLL
jgi:hypothetical protein